MNLPNYFLADLPPEAVLTGGMMAEAALTLKRNRSLYLAERSTASIIRLLSDVADGWREANSPLRKMALEQGPAATGFSTATLARGLDDFFKQITVENLRALVTQELGQVQRLDDFCASPTEAAGSRLARAQGPEFICHIVGGSLPNPVFMSIILGLLTRSAQFVKCASGCAFLPRLFAHSLYEADGKLASCLEVAEWRGGAEELEAPIFAEADCVTATGSDETLAAIRQRVSARARFVGYGQRVSLGFVTQESLTAFNPKKIAERAGADVTAWNQLGCLSPHVIYVEEGAVTAEYFAELLSQELASREEKEPRGWLPAETAAGIAAKRAFYEIRAAHSPDTKHWVSENSTAWTVVYEADALFQLSSLNRFIYVKPVKNLAAALAGADAVRGKVSTVGVAALEEKMADLVKELSRWGVTRVCALGRMQEPSLLWRHDGRPALEDLVTWTDWEQ
jgi:hypothetical protein